MSINAAIQTLREAAQDPDTDLWDLMSECLAVARLCTDRIKELDPELSK